MGRMQVLELGLVLVFSWAGWASSAPVYPTKIPGWTGFQMEGRWYHIFPASKEVDLLNDNNHMCLCSPSFECIGRNCDAISLEFMYSYHGYSRYVTEVMERRLARSDLTWEPKQSSWVSLNSMDEGNVPPLNILDLIQVSDSLLLLPFANPGSGSSSDNTYTIMAVGQKNTLGEADMAEFQKVLGDNGIVAAPMDFICIEINIDIYIE